MKYTITPLGGAGRSVRRIAGDVVDYLLPNHGRPAPSSVSDADGQQPPGPARYYADSGDGGWWSGRGAAALGLDGDVSREDLAAVLAGRDPRTGERLITAQGSAGRRPRLGVGAETRRGPAGEALYGARDVAAVLGIPERQAARMLEMGAMLALSRLFGLPVRGQPEGSYLVPRIDSSGARWVDEAELSRCEDALHAGTSAGDVERTGPAGELLALGEAARLAGLTPRYLRRLVLRYEADGETIDAAVAAGRASRRAFLVGERGSGGRWFVTRGELAAFLARRRPPAVRVGFDVTLTTEKSVSVLALLSGAGTRRAVLDAIRAGNTLAMGWLEGRAAAGRARGEVVMARGWTVASFEHHTSRSLDPFAHVHNVVANTVEDQAGERRALDARGLYRHARAASALATAEMRWHLSKHLAVRWRRAGHGGWEVAGVPDEVVREFSRRSGEIEDAVRELEEAIGRGLSPGEFDRVKTATRPGKAHTPADELLPGWWRRAGALGFGPGALGACVGAGGRPTEPDAEALYRELAAPDGICANLSVFDRGDVLAALVDHPMPGGAGAGDDAQPVVVPAARLEELADGFLASRHVERLAAGTATSPALYSTQEMLALQERVIARYRHGRHAGAARAGPADIALAFGEHQGLTAEQQELVRAFCGSGHRIQCAVGHPGAGKTTAMAAARAAWESAGWRVLGAAVKGEAARTLAVTAGIPTETLAWYLARDDPLRSPLDARTVLVIDEASTVSDRDLDKLGWLAATTGAALRLVGDPAQHGAVEPGGMFRVLCEHHTADTPVLTGTHRLEHPRDRAAADLLRAGDVAGALDQLAAAGHLHVVEDEFDAYTRILADWWRRHLAGRDHPMVSRSNDARRTLNRLAHQLRRAAGEVGHDELPAGGDRRYGVGDRVIARAPARRLHPPGHPEAYVRNGSTGTVTALHTGPSPGGDTVTVAFDGIGVVDVPRSFFDAHEVEPGRNDVGLDHAYALTSYAVPGSTQTVSTSRIDETSTRAEAYVDITRGRQANHLYVTRARDDLDGEHLPRLPPDPIEDTVTRRLSASEGERTAWEIRETHRQRTAPRPAPTEIAL